ncbi:MAG: hypothetical protein HY204_02075 [Nitrospirae bacterium]|nr:hypothetical protein [Nitrospirota bacterium]
MNQVLLFLLLISCPALTFAQAHSASDPNHIAKDVEQRFRACPRREVVARFKRRFHKAVWQKQAWGPPSDVIADVRPNDSILYPYVLTVEFNLSISMGPERESKTESESDTELSQSSLLVYLGAATSRNRNVYLIGKDSIRLKTREILTKKFSDGTPGQWVERSTWANACWDWIDAQ